MFTVYVLLFFYRTFFNILKFLEEKNMQFSTILRLLHILLSFHTWQIHPEGQTGLVPWAAFGPAGRTFDPPALEHLSLASQMFHICILNFSV